jgi:hypothetical protein
MADKARNRSDEDTPDELKGRPENSPGMSDYDESDGTGLEPRPGDELIGGGVSGGDSDPIRERVNERTDGDTR